MTALAAQLGAGATIDVGAAAEVIGVSRATLYAAIKAGTAPVRVIRVGSRIKVVTSSVRALIGDDEPVRSGDTASQSRSSEAHSEAATTSGVKCELSDGGARAGAA